jgi:hypothetical protein
MGWDGAFRGRPGEELIGIPAWTDVVRTQSLPPLEERRFWPVTGMEGLGARGSGLRSSHIVPS